MTREQARSWIKYSPEFLAARAEFASNWNALVEKGLQKKYLEWTNDYSGSHLEVTEETGYDGPMEFTETEEEYEMRILAEVERRVEVRYPQVMENITAGQ